ncbi:FecR family protein [Methyloradius palustris]|uniref:Sensor n=1 Tax=Methyloradius palustris TaxID=2778876 RepID=A0A8D5G462_9PROT|nr:FecR domain-containing protein [Methyloradius palustris]BCM25658.1 sensor [Methyloradius palustris]
MSQTVQQINISPKHIKSLRETAARWFFRIKNTEPDHPDRGQFEAWLMANPVHAQEYLAVSSVWEDFDSTAKIQSLADIMERKTNELRDERSKKLKQLANRAVHFMVVLGVSLFGYHFWQDWAARPVFQVANITPVGQMQEQVLADGSKLIINANTNIEVTYYRDRRTAKISQGEVIFDVAKDPSRPFVIDSGHARITVLGTHFVVNRLNGLVRVSVDHGSVRVEAQDSTGANILTPIVLHNGEVAEVKPGEMPQRVERNAADAFTFQNGTLVFDEASLEEISETLSRYRKIPIKSITTRHSDPHVTAVMKVRDTERFLALLPEISPIKIEQTDNQTLLIGKK